jgi:uncharacterized protein (TIGR01777 family)
MKHWLIAGGTGLIGTRLTSHLQSRGERVSILSRSAKNGITWDSLPEHIGTVDVVVNLAGENLVGARWNEAVKERLVSSRIESTQNIVEAIQHSETRPSVLISASAVGIYGDQADRELTEDSVATDDFLAQLCVDWEDAAKPVVAYGVRLVAPRIGVVLDPSGGALQKMKLPFMLFGGGPIGSGNQYLPWIHIDDLCRMLIWAAETPTVAGPLNGTAPNPVTMKTFASELGTALRRPSWFPVPGALVRVVAGEAASAVLASQRVLPKKALRYGFEFEFTDVAPALKQLLR